MVLATCTQLTSLDLSSCWAVTDEGLHVVAATCWQLTSLDLHNCKGVTDEGVCAVVEACPQLTSLDLCACKKVTDEGLRAVVYILKYWYSLHSGFHCRLRRWDAFGGHSGQPHLLLQASNQSLRVRQLLPH